MVCLYVLVDEDEAAPTAVCLLAITAWWRRGSVEDRFGTLMTSLVRLKESVKLLSVPLLESETLVPIRDQGPRQTSRPSPRGTSLIHRRSNTSRPTKGQKSAPIKTRPETGGERVPLLRRHRSRPQQKSVAKKTGSWRSSVPCDDGTCVPHRRKVLRRCGRTAERAFARRFSLIRDVCKDTRVQDTVGFAVSTGAHTCYSTYRGVPFSKHLYTRSESSNHRIASQSIVST